MLQEKTHIRVTPTQNSKIDQVDWENLPFGKVFSDHMLLMEYRDGAWQDAEIMEFGNISFHPATSAIHYGQAIFEGMKANKSESGELLIFRPEMNARRFQESCERMCMPIIPEDLFVECVRKLVEVENAWIPNKPGYSLYIRPFMFATDEFVGIRPSDTYKFIIFACPVGAYYSEPVNVKIEEHYTRAAEGGVGRAKAAGNYGASMYPAKQGQMQGFHQLLWTDAKTHEYIEESGTMNIMLVINGKLITPSEDSDTILRGITKRSVIEMAQSWGIEVEERKVSVKELVEAVKDGSLTEAFGAGTAATIAHIAKIGYRDEVLVLPAIETRTISNKISEAIDAIKTGKATDTFGWIYKA
ncbi:MAG: branched-chain amino acid aminotransferase [Crocinitomicaceae bacterium]|nr:MAG: branched-chain amino acid aminotransferase [Crocinitomicaceae bacterium]